MNKHDGNKHMLNVCDEVPKYASNVNMKYTYIAIDNDLALWLAFTGCTVKSRTNHEK